MHRKRWFGAVVTVTAVVSAIAPAARAADAGENARAAVALALAGAVKQAAREPESIRFDSMLVSDDAKVACSEYRGRNGFGGMSFEYVVYANGKVSQSNANTWNKHCAKKQLHDLKRLVR